MKKTKIFHSVDEVFINYAPKYTKNLQDRKFDSEKSDHKKIGAAIAKKLTLDFQNTISL